VGGRWSPSVPSNRRALTFIFITVFLDLLGGGLLVPVIPYLVRPYRTDAMTVALLAVSFSAAQFLAGPALGALSDRIGRRPVLVLSVLGSACGYFLFGFATALWMLFAARLLDGVTGGNLSTAQAYIADVTPPSERGRAFGLIGAAFGLGFVFGPAIGGVLSHVSLQAPAFAAGGLSLVTAAFGAFVLPESLPPERRRKGIRWRDLDPIRQIGGALSRPGLRGLLVAVFALNFAFSGLQTNFALFTLTRFGLGPSQNAVFFTVIGLLAVVMQGGVVGRVLKRAPERSVAMVGLGIMSCGFLSLALVPRAWMIFACIVLISVGSGLSNPTLTGMISKRVSHDEQGSILGATQSIGGITRIAGPAWAGLVFDAFGTGAPYATGAVWILAALGAVRASGGPGAPATDASPPPAGPV